LIGFLEFQESSLPNQFLNYAHDLHSEGNEKSSQSSRTPYSDQNRPIGQEPISFSKLKTAVRIESSGRLAFHLRKLTHLVKTDSQGNYTLTDDEKQVLRIATVATWSTAGGGRPTLGSLKNAVERVIMRQDQQGILTSVRKYIGAMAAIHAMDKRLNATVSGATTRRFTEIFQRSIEEAATNSLGETAAKTVLAHVVPGGVSISPKEISSRLHRLFGLGADVVERCIVRELFTNLELPKADERYFDFAREVDKAMQAVQLSRLTEVLGQNKSPLAQSKLVSRDPF
jgi:hypothetical protein